MAVPGTAWFAGDHQAAGSGLDPDARAGCVPRPVRLLHACGDVYRRRPRDPVVRAAQHGYRSAGLARARDDVFLAVGPAVLRGQQPDGPGGAIDDGAGVAEGVRAVVANDLERRPRLAAVRASLQYEIDVSGIAAAVAPGFGEGEQCAAGRRDDRGNAEGVVVPRTRNVDLGVARFAIGDLSGGGAREDEDRGETHSKRRGFRLSPRRLGGRVATQARQPEAAAAGIARVTHPSG